MALGKFLTLEGTEGVGKSTNLTFIRDWLVAKGIDVVVTREPGGTPLAEELRALLLAKRDEPFNETAELLVVFAARAQHIAQVIKPALARGAWVLSDRFTDATFAYQGAGRGLNINTIKQLEELVQETLQPDLTVLLDIDVAIGLERARQRGEFDRFESEAQSFFERVREGYLARVASAPHRYALIDASQTLEHVQTDIDRALCKLLPELIS